jgi:hypothetical protein
MKPSLLIDSAVYNPTKLGEKSRFLQPRQALKKLRPLSGNNNSSEHQDDAFYF